MRRQSLRLGLAALLAGLGIALGAPCVAQACGGVFSRSAEIEQKTERIIFIQNRDGTLTSVIQLKFTGDAEDFAWVLPLPYAIPADAIEVVENGNEMFDALERDTEPIFLKPDNCYPREFPVSFGGGALSGGAPEGAHSVTSGVVGPFSFDIVEANDPQALGDWLRQNQYQFTPAMEPLVKPYIDAGMVFLAMKLRPGQGVDSIEPIKLAFKADRPMIPLRIAAVAARPDTQIRVWFFADQQATPANFARIEVADDELRYNISDSFYTPRGNYDELVNAKLAEANGRGFVTDFAGPTRDLSFEDQQLSAWAAEHPYLTRLTATISPEEMTVDPVFDYDGSLPDRPREHNLSLVQAVVDDCQRQQNRETLGLITLIGLPIIIALGAAIAVAAGVAALLQRRKARTR